MHVEKELSGITSVEQFRIFFQETSKGDSYDSAKVTIVKTCSLVI